jgi:release factor glutamine methyltransferase
LIKHELIALYSEHEIDALSRIIFSHLFGVSSYDLIVRANDPIPEKSEHQIYDIIQQLKRFTPIQYILGETEFYGQTLHVNPAVLIPRPETEELVDWIIKDYKEFQSPKILDIGTGSGCIAISLAKHINNSEITAIDISESALKTAKENADLNNVPINFLKYDILNFDYSEKLKFDIIVSNPPYVTPAEREKMHPNVLDYEPSIALFTPEKDSLVFYKAIAKFALVYLVSKGSIYLEINESLAYDTLKVFSDAGFRAEIRKDIHEKDRMIKAWRNE